MKILNKRKSKVTKFLPEPLKPTKYVAPMSKPKPRTKKSKIPVPLPRSIPNLLSAKVQKLIDEIKPYFKPEAIRKLIKS